MFGIRQKIIVAICVFLAFSLAYPFGIAVQAERHTPSRDFCDRNRSKFKRCNHVQALNVFFERLIGTCIIAVRRESQIYIKNIN